MASRLVLPVVAAVLLAGCSAGLGPAAGPSTTEQSTTTRLATTADRMPYPDPPDELTNESAKRVALDHEEAYVHNRLRTASEVRQFGVRENATTYVDAEVLNASDGGVYVRVHMPYSYSTDSVEADGSTDAVYFVSEETVERVRGDEVSP